MDKYEYKVRADEIKALIAEGEYAEAVKIADTIDWRRVKSVMMLCTISDLYKINRRFAESKDILLLAYEKHPTGRLIVYSLCELSIKMEEYVQAIEYYKEFVQIAPKDTGRYILQYRLYEAQDVSLEERIAVLEEFKKRDYREKWAYELAYLYHRIGLSTKCVEECDEMFLWFGEGKYVIKALELKKLHEPLNADQQDKYDLWMQAKEAEGEPYEEEPEDDGFADGAPENTGKVVMDRFAEETGADASPAEVLTTELPEVKTVDLGQYNTINLQRALAESMREILSEEEPSVGEPVEAAEEAYYEQEESVGEDGYGQTDHTEDVGVTGTGFTVYEDTEQESAEDTDALTEESEAGGVVEDHPAAAMETEESDNMEEASVMADEPEMDPAGEAESVDIVQKTGGVSEASAGGEAEEAAPEEEQKQAPSKDTAVASLSASPEATIRLPDPRNVEKRLRETSVTKFPQKASVSEPPENRKPTMDTDHLQEISAQIVREDTAAFDAEQILEQMKQEAYRNAKTVEDDRTPGMKTGVLTPLNTKPSRYDNILSQEYDGQISLVMPEAERVEKQITGQLSIEDIMAEWEEMKKTNEQKRMEDVRQRILQHTGDLFANFDEATKNGLLEELERAFVAAIMKESGKKPSIKKVVLPDDDTEKKASSVKQKEKSIPEESDIHTAEEPEETEEAAIEKKEETVPEELNEESGTASDLVSEEEQRETEGAKERELTEEERELFGEFVHHRKSERQLVRTLDNMSLAPYTGNVLITGEEEETTLMLAKALVREMQLNDNNFSGRVAKISAVTLNKKNVEETFGKLDNGALIIEKASHLKPQTAVKIAKALDKDNKGLLVLMIGQKQEINELLEKNPVLNDPFNLRVDIEPLDNEALVAYARQYAEEMEYSIDEFGILALHTRIADRQTSDHEVSMAEVRELVDEAIYYANKKTPGHFMDILLAKRYDEDDMIILREKDFMHY